MKWLKVNTVLLLSAVLSFWGSLSQADTQFRIIVDASGSMVISDPDKLTSEALRLISNLAPEEEATLGVWLFGEAPRVLLPEAPVNKATKAKLANYVNNYVTQDVKTDLEAIMQLLLETPDSGDLKGDFERHWILVTDGMVDISLDEEVNKASRDRILADLTKVLEEKGIHLHTISMTGYTDKELLEELSLRTNSTHTEVAVPEDLLATFDRIFSLASPSDELPFADNRFIVDDAIEELTLVVFHDEGIQPEIIKPDGTILSLTESANASVAASEHYTLITVNQPSTGEWQVNNVDLARSSIRIITNLSAQATKVPAIVFVNEVVHSTVGLFQQDILISDEKILDLLTVKQTLIRLSGEKRETILSYEMNKANSQFKQNLPQITEPGNYEFISLVDGKTFSRQLSQYFTVHPAIHFSGRDPGGKLMTFAAKPVNLKLNVLRSHVILEFTDKNGTVSTEEMPLVGQGFWEKIVPFSPENTVQVRAKLSGVTQTGTRFDYWAPAWRSNQESEREADIGLNNASSGSILVTSAPSSNREVMAALVAPAISIVDEVEKETFEDTVLEESLSALGSGEENDVDASSEEVTISSQEWIMYAVLNLSGIIIVVGGILLFRRIKNK